MCRTGLRAVTRLRAGIARWIRREESQMSTQGRIRDALRLTVAATAAVAFSTATAWAGPREQAKRMHDRLVGVPPTPAVLDSMEAQIAGGNALAAAQQAMSHPLFYSSALKNWITPWTNVARTVFAPLNDYTATVIGIIRDDRPFTDVLTADVVYVGAPGVSATPYSHTDNAHYAALEADRVDLSNPALLVPVTQSGLPGAQISPGDAAGILT